MNTHIVRNTGNIASRFPHRSFSFVPSHSLPHPYTTNEKIKDGRHVATWPARSEEPRPFIGLGIVGTNARSRTHRAGSAKEHWYLPRFYDVATDETQP